MRTESEMYTRGQIAAGTAVATDEGIKMEGYVNMTGRWFSVPLIQQVTTVPNPNSQAPSGRLWQGGCLEGVRLPDDFDFVLSLYPWERYILGPDTERQEITMYDSLGQATEQAQELAAGVVERLNSGQKVLIHCQAGLNRSGLITALALIKLSYTPDEAIGLLRKQRCDQVLSNPTFEQYVRDQA